MANKRWTNNASASRCTITQGEDYEVVCTVKDVETAELIVKAVNQNDRFDAALDKLSEWYAYCVKLETDLANIVTCLQGMKTHLERKDADVATMPDSYWPTNERMRM